MTPPAAAPGCPDEAAMLRYLAGDAREHAAALEAHVDGCDACRMWLAALARTSIGLPSIAGAPITPAEAPALSELLPAGTDVGRYRIVEVIGRGGLGVVYRAEDPELRRAVAIKVLRAVVAELDAAKLLAEARTMARLSHPHVCPVLDIGVVGDRWFLAMPLLEGGTLAHWLAAAPRTTSAIVAAFVAAARGLRAAHEIGIVHRDFKPSNALLDGEGRVVVTDFGLAGELTSDGEIHGTHGGTPHYMAPEQRRGTGDARVDQYALGVALRDALEGRRLPRSLARTIDRATAVEPSARFTDMAALADALADHARARSRWPIAAAFAAVGTAAVIGVVAIDPPSPQLLAEPATDDSVTHPPEVAPEILAALERAAADDRAGATDVLAQIDAARTLAASRGDQAGIAVVHIARGEYLIKGGRTAEALLEFEAAFDVASRIARDDLAAEAAISQLNLLTRHLGRPDDARRWARHVEATIARLDRLDVDLRAELELAFGRTDQMVGDLDSARRRYTAALALLDQQPDGHDLERKTALQLLGELEAQLGALTDARTHLERAEAIATRVFGPTSPELVWLESAMAQVDARSGDPASARRRLERGREILVASVGESHADVIALDSNLVNVLGALGDDLGALAVVERALPRAAPELAVACVLQEQHGMVSKRLGRVAPARTSLRRAVECYDRVLGPGSAEATLAAADLATLAPR